jgi:hypothetical protein
MSPHDLPDQANTHHTAAVPLRTIVVLVAAMAAAWIAAGSTGLLADPLRHALSWVALAVMIVAGWPGRDEPLGRWLALGAAVPLGLMMTAVAQPAVNVLAVTLVTAALARSQVDLHGRVIRIAALATAVLAVFRLASSSIPSLWLAADALGCGLGQLAGMITGQPLWLGASFGGVDFLVLMLALYAGWLISTTPPRLPRAVYAAAAILLGHLIYLVVLAFSGQIVAALPDVVLPPESDKSLLGVWAWGNAARTLLPWNLPMLALVLHATTAAVMFRWAMWLPVAEPAAPRHDQRLKQTKSARRIDALLQFAPVALAAVIPLVTVLSLSRSDLSGKTIVAAQQGFLDWDRPQYGARSTGMYGMLDPFIESLGGEFVKSPDLSAQDLQQADVLLLLHPNQDWSKQPETLQRIWEFVRGGGSLLVVAEPEMHRGELKSTFNEVLVPTAMRVRQDTAVSETVHWEHSYQPLAHPVTDGIGNWRNRFGLLLGSSIDVHWPARPLLVGRWAWSEPGSDAVRSGAAQYDSGKKLGDLVLAAEQPLGEGTVIVLGDTSSLQNDVIANSYPFAGRLLGYLAATPPSPQAGWRQLLGLLAMVTLVGLLGWRARPLHTGLAAVVLAGSLIGCVAVSHYTARVLPGRGAGAPSGYPELACIDASHLEAYSSDTWSNFGIAGFSRTLMRSGYLPLLLPELTAERLKHAELLISIGPARQFSATERQAVRDFVESGGTFICMAGAEHAAASRKLLAAFGFAIPPSPVPPTQKIREPEPLGNFRTLYLNTDEVKAAMQTYASWEVQCSAPDRWLMAQWSDGVTTRPFVISRPVGRGTVVVIGDTYLATNQNLESAVNTLPENVNFWRWLLTHVTHQQDWTPPPAPAAERGPPAELPAEKPADTRPASQPREAPKAVPRQQQLPDELPPEDPTKGDPSSHEVRP